MWCKTVGLIMAFLVQEAAFSVEHPVFPAKKDILNRKKLERDTALVRSLPEGELADWIVGKSSFQMIACPNCDWPGGRRDRHNYWSWKAATPTQITCTHCGMTFPNARYPLDRVDEIADPTGQIQRYPYWPAADGYKFYLQGKIDNCRKQFMEDQVMSLARLHVVSGELAPARRAALILLYLARAYPHYNVQICRQKGSPSLLPTTILKPENGIQPVPGLAQDMAGFRTKTHYPYWSNRRGDGWNGWFYSETPAGLVRAYDLIAASPVLATLSKELEGDVAAEIKAFFRATVNYLRSFPIYLGNMDPQIIGSLAAVGRVIGEPEFVHDAVRRCELLLKYQFFADGNWRECAPSYHSQAVYGLARCLNSGLAGYTDPPGYRHPVSGRRFDDLQAKKDMPMLGEALSALRKMKFPNGDYAAVHDTWPKTTRGKAPNPVGSRSAKTVLHWAMGHAILGVGAGLEGLQAHLHFSGGYGHTHADTLNLILFGGGREAAADLGYTHTVLRPYACSSLAHNLVLVDQKDQRNHGGNPPADGSLTSWGMVGDCLRFCEADGRGAYPGISEYRRGLVLVSAPGNAAYVIDVFRVCGGRQHDWLLHGGADAPESLLATPALESWQGSLLPAGAVFHRWGVAEGEYGRNLIKSVNNSYGLFEDLHRAPGDEARWFDFRPESGAPRLRTWLAPQPGAMVYSGTLPSIRPAREDSAKAYAARQPVILLRNEGEDTRSVFTAMHQMLLTEDTRGIGVTAIKTDEAGSVALLCDGAGFVDLHVYTAGSEQSARVRFPEGDLEVDGRYGFARLVDGKLAQLAVVDGRRATFNGETVSDDSAFSARVLAVQPAAEGESGDRLIVDHPLPVRTFAEDRRVVVRFADESTHVLAVTALGTDTGGHGVVSLSTRSGFRFSEDGETAIHTHHPHRKMPGAVSVRLPGIQSR